MSVISRDLLLQHLMRAVPNINSFRCLSCVIDTNAFLTSVLVAQASKEIPKFVCVYVQPMQFSQRKPNTRTTQRKLTPGFRDECNILTIFYILNTAPQAWKMSKSTRNIRNAKNWVLFFICFCNIIKNAMEHNHEIKQTILRISNDSFNIF